MRTANTLNWLIALAGVWEILAPFILGYADVSTALWNAIIVGIVLIILAVWAALTNDASTEKNLSWVNAVVGLWLVLAPFILGYAVITAALWNAIIVGIVVIILAVWAAMSIPRIVAD